MVPERRGTQQEFAIKVNNPLRSSLKDIKIDESREEDDEDEPMFHGGRGSARKTAQLGELDASAKLSQVNNSQSRDSNIPPAAEEEDQ